LRAPPKPSSGKSLLKTSPITKPIDHTLTFPHEKHGPIPLLDNLLKEVEENGYHRACGHVSTRLNMTTHLPFFAHHHCKSDA